MTSQDMDSNSSPSEDSVKNATNLRDGLDLQRFCEDIVPEFTYLGGNRPDCAVVSGAAVLMADIIFSFAEGGLVHDIVENRLPPDVFACTAGILCAPVVITGLRSEAARGLCEQRGPARRLSIRLRLKSEEEMLSSSFDDSFPWIDQNNDYQSVFVRMELPPEVVTLPDCFLDNARMVKSIDLRSTSLTALGNYCMSSPELSQVHLPSTVTSIGNGFLVRRAPGSSCWAMTSIDLRHLTGLTSLGALFMYSCNSLTEVHVPASVTTIDRSFLSHCPSITSIDLRHLTGLTSLGHGFMSGCDSLTELHLPPSVSQISASFLTRCANIVSIDLRYLAGLTSLGRTFMGECSSLTEIHLPPSVTRIRDYFLYECNSIASIDLRHLIGLTSLDSDFMYSCDSLTEVYLPDTVTELPDMFLANCKLDPVCHWVGSRRGEKRERSSSLSSEKEYINE